MQGGCALCSSSRYLAKFLVLAMSWRMDSRVVLIFGGT